MKASNNLPIEGARCAQSVRPHLTPSNPVSDIHPLGKINQLPHAINRVAGRPPNTDLFDIFVAHLHGKINLELDIRGRREGRGSSCKLMADSKRMRVHDLVVEHDAVKRPINTVVDVVY